MNDDPIKRFTFFVLFQAQQDRATDLVVAAASESGIPIRYKVGGTWHDMSPPPPHIRPGLVAELRRLANLPEGPYPLEGMIDVPFSNGRLRWIVQMTHPDGECTLVRIPE